MDWCFQEMQIQQCSLAHYKVQRWDGSFPGFYQVCSSVLWSKEPTQQNGDFHTQVLSEQHWWPFSIVQWGHLSGDGDQQHWTGLSTSQLTQLPHFFRFANQKEPEPENYVSHVAKQQVQRTVWFWFLCKSNMAFLHRLCVFVDNLFVCSQRECLSVCPSVLLFVISVSLYDSLLSQILCGTHLLRCVRNRASCAVQCKKWSHSQNLFINWKNCPISILYFSIKMTFFNPNFSPTWKPCQNCQKSISKCHLSKPHTIYYISSIYFFHQIFVPSEIQRHYYIHTPFFLHFQIWTFWPQEPKNSNLTNSFLVHYPQHKMNQKSPKDPESILILTIKLLYTYFWKTLPTGALIWLALIWLAWAEIMSNHLKILGKDFGQLCV